MSAPNRIREVREAKGLTQTQLGKRCGKNQQWIQRLECGVRTLTVPKLQKIAEQLKCSPLELLPEDMVPAEMVDTAALYARLSPEDRAVAKRIIKSLAS